MHQVERAIFDLRRGLPIVVHDESDGADRGVLVYPIESLTEDRLTDVLDLAGSAPTLTLTRHRMAAMGFPMHTDSASLPLRRAEGLSAEALYCAAAAAEDPRTRLFEQPRPASASERAALALMRRALLVPAALTATIDGSRQAAVERAIADGSILRVSARSAEQCFDSGAGMLKRVSEADVPLSESVQSRFVLFREPDGLREHLAVLIGESGVWPEAVPTRLHSACLTGDLFGSLRCDCGEQLQNAVRTIAQMGGGVLLYLAQEGRGIGLANKLRAYALQDEGLDTIDADRMLGFGEDSRRYRVAVDMLTALSIRSVKLLTNNPSKVDALREGGIEVAARDGLYGRLTRQNRRYLKAKASRSGHLLDDFLDE
ncbi:GTP cyclohydrolase II [Wenzhouxiangella sp. EGI_FJ10409]|uniref:GTP cyclohydrolase II n=1 Tax=Wenzhouxiangella sp. EGI_FJ10409 TaxID=3243767 RepID=UPI0035D87533